jgi:hypothetical protein
VLSPIELRSSPRIDKPVSHVGVLAVVGQMLEKCG